MNRIYCIDEILPSTTETAEILEYQSDSAHYDYTQIVLAFATILRRDPNDVVATAFRRLPRNANDPRPLLGLFIAASENKTSIGALEYLRDV